MTHPLDFLVTGSAGGALLGGTLDEEAEHAEFAKAVAAWRSGSGTETGGGGGSVARIGAEAGGEGKIVSSEAVAEKLAAQLEAGFRTDADALSVARREAEASLRRQEVELRRAKAAAVQRAAQQDADSDEEGGEGAIHPGGGGQARWNDPGLGAAEEEKGAESLSWRAGPAASAWASPPLSPASDAGDDVRLNMSGDGTRKSLPVGPACARCSFLHPMLQLDCPSRT